MRKLVSRSRGMPTRTDTGAAACGVPLSPEVVGVFSMLRPSSLPLPAPRNSWSTEHVWQGCF